MSETPEETTTENADQHNPAAPVPAGAELEPEGAEPEPDAAEPELADEDAEEG